MVFRGIFTVIIFVFCFVNICAKKEGKCSYVIDEYSIVNDFNLDNFITTMQNDSFKVYYDKKAIPKVVLNQLVCLRGGLKPFIANPTEPYNSGHMRTRPRLPFRQLIYMAKSKNALVLTYKAGGRAPGNHILLVNYNKKGIFDLWTGFGHGSLDSIDEIINSINEHRNKKWGLHTNVVYF